jgi:hypothetical protein
MAVPLHIVKKGVKTTVYKKTFSLYPNTIASHFEIPNITLNGILQECAAQYGDKIALTFYHKEINKVVLSRQG